MVRKLKLVSPTPAGDNSLPQLAADIREALAGCRTAAEASAVHAIAAGRLLIEAKALIGHGRWSRWLKENVGFSERTAQRYMQLVNSGVKTATLADLGIRGAAEALADSAKLKKLELHPYCEVFPWVDDATQRAITESICRYGLHMKITLYEGKILDGKLRYKSLLEIGNVTHDHFETFDGDDEEALDFVIAKNLVRKHHSESQLALAAARMADLEEQCE